MTNFTYQESAGKEEFISKAEKGAQIAPVNYSDKTALVSALAGIDVVISALPNAVLDQQVLVAEAAKEAGVKAFAPSEFGMATDKGNEGPLAAKKNSVQKIQDLGLPTTLFFTGGFADWIWLP